MMSSALDEYCGSQFWNTSLSWNTTDPDLTKCFEKTVLVWVPCVFLWIFSFFEVYFIVNSKNRNIPWNWLNVSKLLVTSVLIVLSIIDFSVSVNNEIVHKVDIYTPVIKVLTFALSVLIVYYNRKYGLQSSGLLFFFWSLLLVCGGFQFRTEIREEGNEASYYSYISYLIYYPLILMMFLLNCFADKRPRETFYPLSKMMYKRQLSSDMTQMDIHKKFRNDEEPDKYEGTYTQLDQDPELDMNVTASANEEYQHCIARESFRLIDEKIFPLTKSGSKQISVGIDPLACNDPKIRLLNQQQNSKASFTNNEFRLLTEKLPGMLEKIKEDIEGVERSKWYNRKEEDDHMVLKLTKYKLFLLPNQVIRFCRISEEINKYNEICLTIDTLHNILTMGPFLLTIMNDLKMKQECKFYPNFDRFTSNITQVIRDGKMCYDEAVIETIKKKYSSSVVAFELYNKFYYTIKKDVDKKS